MQIHVADENMDPVLEWLITNLAPQNPSDFSGHMTGWHQGKPRWNALKYHFHKKSLKRFERLYPDIKSQWNHQAWEITIEDDFWATQFLLTFPDISHKHDIGDTSMYYNYDEDDN